MERSNNRTEQQKELAKQHAQKNAKNALKTAETLVVSLFNEKKLPEFLKIAARFHYFDVYNILLIYKQHPTATFVATFAVWKKFNIDFFGDANRRVLAGDQKGRGINILTPILLRKTNTTSEENKVSTTRESSVPYFDYVQATAFDKSQVNGIPSPVTSWDLSCQPLDAQATFEALRSKAPFVISYSAPGEFEYNFSFKERGQTDTLKDNLILNNKFRQDFYNSCNFAIRPFVQHSLKHLLKKYKEDDYNKIVECAAFMVSSYFNLPADKDAFFFMNNWTTNTKETIDILETIRQAAHFLINTLEDEINIYKNIIGPTDDVFDNDDVFEFQDVFDI